MQCFMCFLFSGLLEAFAVTDYLAAKIMSAKLIIGRPWLMVTFVFLAITVISGLSSTIAAMFLFWAIITKVGEMVGCEKGDRFIGFIMAGCVFVGFTTSMILPFKPTSVTYINLLRAGCDVELPPLQFIIFMTIVVTVIVINTVG